MRFLRFRRAVILYFVVTILGLVIIVASVQREPGPGPAVPAFSDTSKTAVSTTPRPSLLDRAFGAVRLDVETFKSLLKSSIPLLDQDQEPGGFRLAPREWFGWLFRYLTGIRPGDPRTVFATQLPFLMVAEGDPDSAGVQLILPEPLGDPADPPPLSVPSGVAPEIRQLIEAGKPLVLIYHTHTQEAYLGPTFRQQGFSQDDAFTADRNRDVVAVGTELARVLQEDYGIGVIHVVDYFDMPPDGKGVTKIQAYSRSLSAVEPVVRANPQVRVIIDLHRDAFPDSVSVAATVSNVPGSGKAARVMFVVGEGIKGRLEQPFWRHNLALAQRINNWLEANYPGLSRGILKDRNRYNQHLAPGALLIEVGEVQNTLDQAKVSARILAHAIARQILSGSVETAAQVNGSP